MSSLLVELTLLAQEGAAPQGGDGQGGGGGNSLFFLFIAVLFMLFYMVVLRPAKRERNERETMLANLKKNDRVLTAGGIKGTVHNVHREANEVTVTVDESSGTKIRFTIDSIARVESAKSDE